MRAFAPFLAAPFLAALFVSGPAWAEEPPPKAPSPPPPEAGTPPEAPPVYAPSAKPDLVVTASRTEEPASATPQSVGIVTQTEIERRQPKSAFHALREEPGVWLTQANETFRFPIIRGRQGDDLIYLRDGTRLISFQALDFPLGLIERIEYVSGPGSVQYGSNALGGVLNIITKRVDMYPDKPRFGGEAYARYGSVNRESTDYLNTWIATKHVNAMVGATFQRLGDYTSPTYGRIRDSGGFRAINLYAEVGVQPAKNHELRASYVMMRKNDQVFYGLAKTNPSGIPNNVLDHENRDMLKLEYKVTDAAPWLSEFKVFTTFQTNERLANITTETPVTVVPGTLSRNDISVDQWYFAAGTQAKTPFKVVVPGRFVYGADFRLEDIAQPRSLVTTDKGTGVATTNQIAGAIPKSRYDVVAAFLLAELSPIDRLTLQGGVRLETTGFRSTPDAIDAIAPFTARDLTLNKRWTSVVWSAGVVGRLSEHLSVAANVGTGFRVPTPFELVLTQVQGNAQGISTIPSTTLKPVRSTTYEAGPRWASKFVKAAYTGYYTALDDLIGFVNTPLTIDVPGIGVVPTRRNENSLHGYVMGVESSLEVRAPFRPELSIFGNFSRTFGRDTQRDVPLRGIPPMNGIAGLRWESRPRLWWTEAVMQWAARKTSIAPEEKTDTAFATDPGLGGPNATTNPPLTKNYDIPGYAIFNVRGGGRLWQRAERSLDLAVAVNNVLNTSYRPAFAAIREAPGIGADVALKAVF